MKKINITWIIDDDPIQVFVNKRLLTNMGFSQSIHAWDNAKNALEELHKLRGLNESEFPDIIFVDINMPQMDGWDFLKELNKMSLDREVDIYLVTSSINPEDVKRAGTVKSLSGYLIKPLKNTDLEKIHKDYIG